MKLGLFEFGLRLLPVLKLVFPPDHRKRSIHSGTSCYITKSEAGYTFMPTDREPKEPTAVPWRLIDASTDMMNSVFCNDTTPNPFRSSLALFAYEPPIADIPVAISCDRKILFLKVSCSITGYQPDGDEQKRIIDYLATLPGVDLNDIEQITRLYLACYGVLLNISVFPGFQSPTATAVPLEDYPRIIDFEPKLRDLYQAASETGEILSTSASKVATDKSLSSTEKTENAWKIGSELKIPTKKADVGLKAETGSTRTETDQTNWGVKSEAVDDRKSKYATTTQISQLYSLLTGYHLGTNRASFLMLPRPHILQPTENRTFVHGLRAIEGVQDFFLVVSLPKAHTDLRVEARLQTGHFPEGTEVLPTVTPEDQYDTMSFKIGPFDRKVLAKGTLPGVVGAIVSGVTGGEPSYRETKITEGPQLYDVPGLAEGWEFDTSKGDPGHAAITELKHPIDNLEGVSGIHITPHVYKREGSENVLLDIAVRNSRTFLVDGTTEHRFFREYEVFLRKKRNLVGESAADSSRMIIAQRKVCTQIRLGDCLKAVPPPSLPSLETGVSIIDETYITGGWAASGIGQSVANVIDSLKDALCASQNSVLRQTSTDRDFLDTATFRRLARLILPDDALKAPVTEGPGQESGLPSDLTLSEFLSASDDALARRLGRTIPETIALRRATFGRRPSAKQAD